MMRNESEPSGSPGALHGKTVLVTRPEEDDPRLSRLLAKQGATAYLIPTIQIVPVESWEAFDCVIRNELLHLDWLVFTSRNAVRFLAQRLKALQVDLSELRHLRIACIGKTTAAAVRELAWPVELVPDDSSSEGLAEGFSALGLHGQRIWMPGAKQPRELLPEYLRKQGAEVIQTPVYKTGCPPFPPPFLKELVVSGRLDWLTFCSPSAIKNFVKLTSPQVVPAEIQAAVACIGPTTRQALLDHRFRVTVTAPEQTLAGLVWAMESCTVDAPTTT